MDPLGTNFDVVETIRRQNAQIVALHELVATLKQRIAVLEQQRPPAPEKKAPRAELGGTK
jgi:hypothetical protein